MALFNIGFVIFPDLTQLDFTGPLQVLSRLPQSIAVAAAATKYLDRRTLAALGRSLGNANAYRRAGFLYCPCDDGLRRLGPYGFSAARLQSVAAGGDERCLGVLSRRCTYGAALPGVACLYSRRLCRLHRMARARAPPCASMRRQPRPVRPDPFDVHRGGIAREKGQSCPRACGGAHGPKTVKPAQSAASAAASLS